MRRTRTSASLFRKVSFQVVAPFGMVPAQRRSIHDGERGGKMTPSSYVLSNFHRRYQPLEPLQDGDFSTTPTPQTTYLSAARCRGDLQGQFHGVEAACGIESWWHSPKLCEFFTFHETPLRRSQLLPHTTVRGPGPRDLHYMYEPTVVVLAWPVERTDCSKIPYGLRAGENPN